MDALTSTKLWLTTHGLAAISGIAVWFQPENIGYLDSLLSVFLKGVSIISFLLACTLSLIKIIQALKESK
jgi:hypothetical protein